MDNERLDNPKSRTILKHTVTMLNELKLDTIVEGVENEKDEDQCKQMNALYLQGYKYSKPIPIEELTRFLGRAV